jgi:glycyl-tRNA synthetase
MKPFLPKNYPHGLVVYDEYDIELREHVINSFTIKIKQILTEINPAIKMVRVETPITTPKEYLQSHIETNFELNKTDEHYLRPETTRGTFECLKLMYPNSGQLRKKLPVCIWQAGKSFRNEQNRPFGELRFKEFYQLEYQLVYPENTKVDYLNIFVSQFVIYLEKVFNYRGVFAESQEKLPHYSKRTTDIYLDNHEIIGISDRIDFDYPVMEIACGLDRVTNLMRNDNH